MLHCTFPGSWLSSCIGAVLCLRDGLVQGGRLPGIQGRGPFAAHLRTGGVSVSGEHGPRAVSEGPHLLVLYAPCTAPLLLAPLCQWGGG